MRVAILPSGSLLVDTTPGDDEASVATQTIGETGHHILVKGGDAPRYAAKPGLLLYSRLGDLFAWTSVGVTLLLLAVQRVRHATVA